MAIHVYQYPKCSTCKRAMRWLEDRDIPYETTDMVANPIPAAKLRDLQQRSGLPVRGFFNTQGESYRTGNLSALLRDMSEDDALATLAKDGKLVKRPILDTGEHVLVGYDEDAYDKILG